MSKLQTKSSDCSGAAILALLQDVGMTIGSASNQPHVEKDKKTGHVGRAGSMHAVVSQ